MIRVTRRNLLRLMAGSVLTTATRTIQAHQQRDPSIVRFTEDASYDVTHTATIAVGNTQLRWLEVWLPVPMDHPEQDVQNLKITPKLRIQSDETGLAKVAGFYSNGRLPGSGKDFHIELTYRLTSRRIVIDRGQLGHVNSGTYQRDRKYRTHTRPETRIEIEDPEIVRQAKLLRDRMPKPWDFARAAYDWILERTTYRRVSGLKGAKYCLERGEGECGDYSALFVALCRATGIPARPVTGFWAGKTDSWHVWAEFMLPNGDWVPVDGSIGDQNPQNYERSFGTQDNKRAVLCKTFDVKFPKKRHGHGAVDFLQVGAWWYGRSNPGPGSGKPNSKFSISGRKSSP